MEDISRWLNGRFVALVMGLALTGCGGGGSDDDDNASPAPPRNDFAAASLAGQTLTLDSGNGSARQIIFSAAGNNWSEIGDDPEGGTYLYTSGENSAEVVLARSGAESTVNLVFGSASSGTFVFTNGEAGQGNFMLEAASNNPTPGPDEPGSGSGGSGLSPRSLSGRTMLGTRTFTSTGPVGQTHVYTFSGNGFHDSDPPEESDGAFQYKPDGDRPALTLAYNAPQDFNGDRHELQLTFYTSENGGFESVYRRRDGTVIQINGTFELQ